MAAETIGGHIEVLLRIDIGHFLGCVCATWSEWNIDVTGGTSTSSVNSVHPTSTQSSNIFIKLATSNTITIAIAV